MGLLDSLKSVFGAAAEDDASREADPEDLFGMSTAYLTMEADLEFAPAGQAALCFGDVDSTAFAAALDEVEAILEAGAEDTGTTFRRREDAHGYHWVVLDDPDPEDLVTSVHFAADTFVEHGFGSRLLAAVFAFTHQRDDDRAYWLYSFRRGAYYPFVPADVEARERDSSREFKLATVLDGELDVEEEKEHWFALWPDQPGGHPWE